MPPGMPIYPQAGSRIESFRTSNAALPRPVIIAMRYTRSALLCVATATDVRPVRRGSPPPVITRQCTPPSTAVSTGSVWNPGIMRPGLGCEQVRLRACGLRAAYVVRSVTSDELPVNCSNQLTALRLFVGRHFRTGYY